MPSNVAVERPDARVIRVILNDHVTRVNSTVSVDACRLQELHVAPLGILYVSNGSVPHADALGEDVEIVAMEMHRVRGSDLILHNDANAVVCPEVVDVPLWIVGVRGVPKVGKQKDRVVVVGSERLSVHPPQDVAGIILSNRDIDCLSSRRVGRSREGKEGRGLRKRIVPTVAIIVGCRNRCWSLGCICLAVVDCCNGMWLFRGCAKATEIGAHEDCRISRHVGSNKDVGTLANLCRTISI